MRRDRTEIRRRAMESRFTMTEHSGRVVERDDTDLHTSLFDLLAHAMPELDGPWMTTSSSVETTDGDPTIHFS